MINVCELSQTLLINCLKNESILSFCAQSVFVQLQKIAYFQSKILDIFLKHRLCVQI